MAGGERRAKVSLSPRRTLVYLPVHPSEDMIVAVHTGQPSLYGDTWLKLGTALCYRLDANTEL